MWWRLGDSNSGHCGYEPHALANWAKPPCVELLTGIEPVTLSLPRIRSTDWATTAYELVKANYEVVFYLTVKKFGSGGRTWTYDLRVMSPTSYQLLHPAIIGGGGRIRTFEGKRRQIYSLLPLATREPHHLLEPTIGLEPTTYWLQVSCSTNWATLAYCSVERSLLYQRTDVLSRTFLSAFLFLLTRQNPVSKVSVRTADLISILHPTE